MVDASDSSLSGTELVVPSIQLNNGVEIPVVGLGTSESLNDKIFTDLIRSSLDAGYRHIDTSQVYNNHKLIGAALEQVFSEGKYKREDLFISTKFFSEKALTAVEVLKNCLADLNLEYVDLFLLHFPFTFADDSTPESEPVIISQPQHIYWAEMEEAYKEKLTRAIGLSNFNVQSIANILTFANVRPAVNQIEVHVYNQQPELLEFCKRFNITVIAYSPLAKGGLQESRFQNHSVDIFGDPVLKEIADAHERTVAQVAMNFIYYELGLVVIPKTERIERLAENINWLNFRLTKEEAEKIRAIDQKRRVIMTQLTKVFGWVDYFA